MIYDPSYTKGELLLEFGKDVLLIAGTYGSELADVFMSTMRGGGIREESDLLALVIAILSVMPVPGKHGDAAASDLFVMRHGGGTLQPMKFEDIAKFLQENRILRWQDEMKVLLDSGDVTAAGIKKALPRNRQISEFLSQRGATKKPGLTVR